MLIRHYIFTDRFLPYSFAWGSLCKSLLLLLLELFLLRWRLGLMNNFLTYINMPICSFQVELTCTMRTLFNVFVYFRFLLHLSDIFRYNFFNFSGVVILILLSLSNGIQKVLSFSSPIGFLIIWYVWWSVFLRLSLQYRLLWIIADHVFIHGVELIWILLIIKLQGFVIICTSLYLFWLLIFSLLLRQFLELPLLFVCMFSCSKAKLWNLLLLFFVHAISTFLSDDLLFQWLLRSACLAMVLKSLGSKGSATMRAWLKNILVPILIGLLVVHGDHCSCSSVSRHSSLPNLVCGAYIQTLLVHLLNSHLIMRQSIVL